MKLNKYRHPLTHKHFEYVFIKIQLIIIALFKGHKGILKYVEIESVIYTNKLWKI